MQQEPSRTSAYHRGWEHRSSWTTVKIFSYKRKGSDEETTNLSDRLLLTPDETEESKDHAEESKGSKRDTGGSLGLGLNSSDWIYFGGFDESDDSAAEESEGVRLKGIE